VVGFDQARDQRLPQPERRVDGHLAAVPGERVRREQDACGVGRDHALHRDGKGGRVVGDLGAAPIGDRARGPQARPAGHDGVKQPLLVRDAQQSVLLSRER